MSDVSRIYLDAAPIIDLVKIRVGLKPTSNVETDAWTLDRLLAAARAGEVQLFTSTLSVAECTHVGDPAKWGETIFPRAARLGERGHRLRAAVLQRRRTRPRAALGA